MKKLKMLFLTLLIHSHSSCKKEENLTVSEPPVLKEKGDFSINLPHYWSEGLGHMYSVDLRVEDYSVLLLKVGDYVLEEEESIKVRTVTGMELPSDIKFLKVTGYLKYECQGNPVWGFPADSVERNRLKKNYLPDHSVGKGLQVIPFGSKYPFESYPIFIISSVEEPISYQAIFEAELMSDGVAE